MNIYEIVEKQRADLLAREYDTVKRIVRAYEVAEKRVEKSIRLFQAKIKQAKDAGLEPSLAWYYQEARLENVLREIRGHLDEFSKDALEFSSQGRDDAYQLGAVHALRLAEAQVWGDIAGLDAGAFANAQALLSASSPLKALFDQVGPQAAYAAREVFAQAVAEGWNPRKTGRALANQIEGLAKRRTVLIARTEQIRAYRTANRDVYARNADVLQGWRWTAAKTPATCALCLAMDGEVFPPEEVLSSHPACRCSMVPLPKTDFGGPKPQSGEAYFQKLTDAEQNRILGKGKAEMYREGKLTLKDNVVWRDSPEWGRQPASRSLADIRSRHKAGTLPSQSGPVRLSPYNPPPQRKLSDLLDQAERKASDPVDKALRDWDAIAKGQPRVKTGLNNAGTAKYKGRGKSVKLADHPSEIQELRLDQLTTGGVFAKSDSVKAFIRNMGDGPDLPIVVREGGRFFIHDGDSVARLEAKRLLGQTKANVRLYDADAFVKAKSPLDEAKETLQALGVKEVAVHADEAKAIQSLEWLAERIKATGQAPTKVVVRDIAGTSLRNGELTLGIQRTPKLYAPPLSDGLKQSFLTQNTPANLQNLKAKVYRVSLDEAENVEAALVRSSLGIGEKDWPDLHDFGVARYDLISVRAFDSVADALDEAIILYRRGEYRLGSLPAKLEKEFLDKAAKAIGKKKTLPAYSEAEDLLFHQVGGQGGSNPGGTYLGRDGVRRYVKFYPQADRAEAEVLANSVYEALGIKVPKTRVFTHNGQSALASEIIEGGQTLEKLGGINADKALLDQALDGYIADAMLANWDVVGASYDNLMVLNGTVYRIDNGGTFIFRAQGGDKADSIIQALEEVDSLGGISAKGYKGQFADVLKRLGHGGPEDIAPRLIKQAEAWAKFAKKIEGGAVLDVGKQAAWKKWVQSQVPSISDGAALRIAKMMAARTKLLEQKADWLKQLGKPVKKRAKKVKTKGAWDAETDPSVRAVYEKLTGRSSADTKQDATEAYKAAGFTQNEINDVRSFVSAWTGGYKASGAQTRIYRYARNYHKGLAPKTDEERLFHKLMATRNERLRYILDKRGFGAMSVPDKYRIWRGHKNDREAIAEVLNAWAEKRPPRIRSHETASWAHRPTTDVDNWDKDGRVGSGAASDFLYREASVLYSTDVPQSHVFVDIIADDASFRDSYYGEREIIPAFKEADQALGNGKEEIWLDGKRYKKKDAAKARAAFIAKYGVAPENVNITFGIALPRIFGGMTRTERAFLEYPEDRVPRLGPYAADDPGAHVPTEPVYAEEYIDLPEEQSVWGKLWT
jgi:hypothetical protein